MEITLKDILKRRGLDACPTPLWKLKLTDTEYEALKQTLKIRTQMNFSARSNRFQRFEEECAVFFSEYWRREYIERGHSKERVYEVIDANNIAPNGALDFYKAAQNGAKKLGIKWYRGERNQEERLETLLYQGGLPMRLLTSGGPYTIWGRFARGLVNRRINFDELNLGVVATNSPSVRSYCEQLIKSLEADRYEIMPFHCDSKEHPWFEYLQRLAQDEHRRRRDAHPFSINWSFMVDEREKCLQIEYLVQGTQKLSASFLENENLAKRYFTVQVRVNGKPGDTFEANKEGFFRYAVKSRHTYHTGENISLWLVEDNRQLVEGELDLSVPHILYRNFGNACEYKLGNRLGSEESFLIIPDGWSVSNLPEGVTQEEYKWKGQTFTSILVPAAYRDTIHMEKDGEHIDFAPSSALYWTEMEVHPLYLPCVPHTDKRLYDVSTSHCHFFLCHEDEYETARIQSRHVEYRCKRQQNWTSTPAFGEIKARVIMNDGTFVTPTNWFINIGRGFELKVMDASERTCHLKISWPHGKVLVKEGKRKDDVWTVKKEDTKDNKMHLQFVPDANPNNQFVLEVGVPFREFFILDPEGQRIRPNSALPFVDIDKYRYHLVGQNCTYTFGGHRRRMKVNEGGISIVDLQTSSSIRDVAYEGSLLSLFDSREQLRAILDKTSRNICHAKVQMKFTVANATLSFCVMEYPYRVYQEENKVVIKSNDWQKRVDYKGTLKVLKMDDPDTQLVLYHDEEKGFVLPEEIREWGKTLLIARSYGRILPKLVTLPAPTEDERKSNCEKVPSIVATQLQKAQIEDDIWMRIFAWFNHSYKEDIPASSIFELRAVGNKIDAILMLASKLYVYTDEADRPQLEDKLKAFSSELAFSWYWLVPYLELAKQLENILGGQAEQFIAWMRTLCKESLLEQYEDQRDDDSILWADDIVTLSSVRIDIQGNIPYVDTTQDEISDETKAFFDKYGERGSSTNEHWMLQRVDAVADHLTKGVNLLEQSDEVRRSIIFCRKSCNKRFVIELNNKLTEH